MLEASWECLAPHGRFIEIGKVDIGANSPLAMAGFAKNRSFAAVDMHYVTIHKGPLLQQLMVKAMDLVASNSIRIKPIHLYAASKTEEAFRYMQSGKNLGRIVIDLGPENIVPVRPKHSKDPSPKLPS